MKIGSIITLYYPNLDLLKSLIAQISNQVDYIYIGDNTPISSNSDLNILLGSFSDISIEYKSFKENLGIAEAQNRGIDFFKRLEFDFILFLDQDSIPSIDLVSGLIDTHHTLTKQGVKIGGLGPRPFNRENKKPYVGMINRGNTNNDITYVSDIISSASLIPMSVVIDVGGMESGLFIDFVDQEFCWRAGSKGYKFCICENILLEHKLGDGDRSFLFRKIRTTSPFRIYFIFRNYLLLVRRKYIPIYWKISVGCKCLIKIFYFPIFLTPRMKYLKSIFAGIKDGVLNRPSDSYGR